MHLDNLKLPARKQQEKNRDTETPSSATVGESNPAHSKAVEPVLEPILEPTPKVVPEAASVPTSDPAPETASAPVLEPVPASVPEPVPRESEKAGVTKDESRSADPTVKWQAYANEPSAIQVRSHDLA